MKALTRRVFLQSLAAIAGVSAIPPLGIKLPDYAEPVKWTVEEINYGFEVAVAAQWSEGASMIRHAVTMPLPSRKLKQEAIAHCKQALRMWYLERHGSQREVA